MGETDRLPELPYARHSIRPCDEGAVIRVLRSDRLAQGPEGQAFEDDVARTAGTRFAIAVSSGTAALEIALGALGVGRGDEVIVPSLTFVATANAVRACGATPVFADVERDTLNLCPRSVAERLRERTCGAIAVHYAGHPAAMGELREVLGPERFLLEDAAHALGGRLEDRPVGSLGDAACFSFHPAKLVTTGEGGAIVTDSDFLRRRALVLREHGIDRDPNGFEGLGLPQEWADEERGPWVYELRVRGGNARLSELAAALGRSQLARAEDLLARRRTIAAEYSAAFADLDEIETPVERPGALSAWHLYPIRLRHECAGLRRADLYRALRERGIGVQVHYVPVHLQPYYRHRLGTRFGDLPTAEDAYLRLLSLPLFPDLADADLDRVVDAVRAALREARR